MILTNCRIVARDELFTGSVSVTGSVIEEVDSGCSRLPGAIDCEGDFLLPGLVELHTDNLEKNIQPRPGVIWPSMLAATLAHDNQLATSGITTVFDAIAVGGLRESSLRSRILDDAVVTLQQGRREKLFRADHYLHLRCEVSDQHMAGMLERHGHRREVRLLSVMDHTPVSVSGRISPNGDSTTGTRGGRTSRRVRSSLNVGRCSRSTPERIARLPWRWQSFATSRWPAMTIPRLPMWTREPRPA